MNLSAAPKELGLSPIHVIAKNLDRVFGKDAWEGYEVETIGLEFNMVLDELSMDKISVLQMLNSDQSIYFNDVLFFLHSTNVINNNIADFDTFPMPTSLEIAYAYDEIKKLGKDKQEFGSGVHRTILYILTNEGYSEPVAPFEEMDIKCEELAKGQTEQDTANKADAIQRYIRGMNELNQA